MKSKLEQNRELLLAVGLDEAEAERVLASLRRDVILDLYYLDGRLAIFQNWPGHVMNWTKRLFDVDESMAAAGLRTRGHTTQVPCAPPISAEFLFFLVMSPATARALSGDLEEHYRLVHKKFGRRRANFWYWVQVVISLRPTIAAALKRVSGLAAIVEAYRRLRS